ncbi:MAG: hypothetical protein GXP31_09620 [Kiritimatiellaeota bacterium]|nr:hypothetical protein [Kiritimatiellota bacterium]
MTLRTHKRELGILAGFVAVYLVCVTLPVGVKRFDNAIIESLQLVRWYAREHVLLCLVPAFFIAGAIAVFVSQSSVLKYLGGRANKTVSYAVASVSGGVLAVCSCTVLPLFAGIYRMGAGLGPAIAFLYSGPAVNVLAIILTARILGFELGLARAVGAVLFSVIIGLFMHLVFRREESRRTAQHAAIPEPPQASRPLWKTALLFVMMIGVLVMANWARSGDIRAVFLCCPSGLNTFRVEGTVVAQDAERITVVTPGGYRRAIPKSTLRELEDAPGIWNRVFHLKWGITVFLVVGLLVLVRRWLQPDERTEWVSASWGLAKQILPLLLIGVLAAGLFLGRPGHEGLIPAAWVSGLVGGNSLRANLFASVVGAFMYFATLTEVPILQGLLANGMGKGPALALLLAGPALSLPNMLVIRSVIGTKKTVVYILLVVVMATAAGLGFGLLVS